ncbi:MAG: hypothetical protein MZV64_73205 [Ignavibacteriales bacterium]|nr:hypothetical protein [Ignavibacteriales bacterium]
MPAPDRGARDGRAGDQRAPRRAEDAIALAHGDSRRRMALDEDLDLALGLQLVHELLALLVAQLLLQVVARSAP